MFALLKLFSKFKNKDVIYSTRKLIVNGFGEVYRVLLAYPIFLAAIALLLLYGIILMFTRCK